MVKELTFPKLDDYHALLEVIQGDGIDLTFPQLVSLHLHVPVTKKLQTFLPLFAPSKLLELEITFDGFNDRLIDTTMETLLVQAHPLRSLEIEATSLPKASREYLIQLFGATPSINSLRLALMSSQGDDIVEAAAHIPNLRALSLDLDGQSGTRNEYSPGFRSLASLKTWSSYAAALAVVRAITSPNISTLNLELGYTIVGPPRSLFEAMAGMRNLKSVSCTFLHSRNPQWVDVEPVLSCPLISIFAITTNSPGMEIDDETISAISHAWPNLTHLSLDGFDHSPISYKRPSLRGLATLLDRCPKLQEVTLEIDARARQLRAALANATPASSEPRGKLLLDVRRSRIAYKSEHPISEFLMSVWPGQCEVVSRWSQHDWQGGTWDKVGELIILREIAI